nr:PQQ-dependent sugar dehydrogenase [Thalassotalea algicola]
MHKKIKLIVISLSILWINNSLAYKEQDIASAKSEQHYVANLVAKGVEVPWAMVQLPNGDILVTERKGELRVISQGKLVAKKVSGLPNIHANGQGGLLDLVLHPEYMNNGWLYFTFSSVEGKGDGSNTALMRAKFDRENMTLTHQEMLYKGSDNTTSTRHYGSRIAFDNQGYVYFSIGDRAERDSKPQDLTLDGGKIYRLHDDGAIPSDNPFVGQDGVKTATYSYGHRNPQGMAKHPETGAIWSHEHGPRGGDEVNIVAKGKNYGWPVISYGINYSGTSFTDLTAKPGMEQPIHYWDPSIAPSGMVFVTSDKYPHWQGKLLVGSLKFHYLVLLDVADNKIVDQHKIFEGIGRLRSIMQGNDGYLYVGIDGGGIKRIEPKK